MENDNTMDNLGDPADEQFQATPLPETLPDPPEQTFNPARAEEESVSGREAAGLEAAGREQQQEALKERPIPGSRVAKATYTIGEVVDRLKPDFPALSVSKIRYLERRRLINLSRTHGGYRLFSEQDVELLKYILTLQEEEYLPLKVIKKRIEGGAPIPSSQQSTNELSRVLEDRTYTREELADSLEADPRFVEDLISVGVIGRNGSLTQRDAEIARMALEMAKYSIQPRHLRGIMAAVEREAAMFKQILNPELRSGDEHRVNEAMGKARNLAAVDSRLKELMMSNVIDTFAP